MQGNTRMGRNMVKEPTHGLMEEFMQGNGRMGKNMVKEHTLGLMEENMLGNGQMGKQNGHGTVTSKDGQYVREWKGNDFHGQGTMISTDGTKWVGEFRENKRWNIREHDNNGNITGKYVNGENK